ncbi:MAG: hypothetical protein ABL871_18640 [Terricaulis sp.]
MIVVATGRFQRLHLGSDRYLQTAKYLAQALRAQFFVTTGPFDNELTTHGERAPGTLNRRLLNFSERQLIISRHLDIAEQTIVPQHASPHHDSSSVDLWASTFFDCLVERGIINSADLTRFDAKQIVLFVATKDADYRDFQATGERIHYSEVVRRANPGIDVVDYTRLARLADGVPLSASNIDEGQLVPVMQVAERLILERGCNDLREYSELIEEARIALGSGAISEARVAEFLQTHA